MWWLLLPVAKGILHSRLTQMAHEPEAYFDTEKGEVGIKPGCVARIQQSHSQRE